MSTSTSIVSLAADLVVFLAAASLLLVLLLRPDLLGVTSLFRAVLSGAATLMALAAVIHGGLDEQGAWLSTLRLAAVVLLAVGCLGVTARWPRNPRPKIAQKPRKPHTHASVACWAAALR